jgi:hypothetical protein
MSPGRTRRTRGISSVFTAVIMALAIIFIIAAIAVSWPMIKSGFDKNYWSGSMGLYTLKFTNSTYAYAQNGAGGQVGTSPSSIGYCIALSPSTTYAISTCPSTTPSYQSPPSSSSSPSSPSPSPPSNNGGGNGGGNSNYYVYVTVTGDIYKAGWEIISSATSISGTNDVNNQQLPIGGRTDTLIAQINSPSGYACSISPSSEQVMAGNSYTFVVDCQPITYYGCLLTVQGQGSPSGAPTPSVNPSGTIFIPSGQTQGITATAPLAVSPHGVSNGEVVWYDFTSWSDKLNGQGTANLVDTWTSNGNTYSTWQYECPSGLVGNITVTLTIIANYQGSYVEISGPSTVGITGAQYTLTWNLASGSATQAQWSASATQYGGVAITATLTYTEGGSTYQVTVSKGVTPYCSGGGIPVVQSVSISPQSQPVSGSSGSATATLYVDYWCCNPAYGGCP